METTVSDKFLEIINQLKDNNQMRELPKNVLQMYSEIWFPDLLDSAKWLSSLFSIRLN